MTFARELKQTNEIKGVHTQYISFTTTHACITPKWDLDVINTISDDIFTLIKSRDNNLGNHTLPFNGNYHRSFGERVVGVTPFYSVWWGSRFQTLNLFNEDVEQNYCYIDGMHDSNCYWFVKPDGFYASAYPNPSGDKVYFVQHWN
ncbi:S-protein homolog 1-like [Lactuca sativa]|uniref:S-protein homolog 1-like n=1 Tax=Lactuca sativa TaxID=4236 RepID=UPI000CD841BC|nr:S-protein homolog 1-like [Lactuca sativa]